MSKVHLAPPAPSSDAETLLRAKRQLAEDQVAPDPASNNAQEPPPESFAAIEGPTLSSPSLNSDSKLSTIAALESRIETLEERLAATERELAEVYGAVEHVVAKQESVDRTLRQQRHGRYLMWGTLIVILVIFWMTLQARLVNVFPH
jgi:uncharacterized coiled-coil protein SlyX